MDESFLRCFLSLEREREKPRVLCRDLGVCLCSPQMAMAGDDFSEASCL
jgi:hypothetical protein